MNEEHFNFLLNAPYEPQGPVGRNVYRFGNDVQNLEVIPNELNIVLSRADLLEICNNHNAYSDLVAVIAIVAWGGMRYDHARRFLSNWERIQPTIASIRNGNIQTRSEAYLELYNLRLQGELPGLGISYFTKLICFLNENINGYILDQWIGKSINLLFDEPVVCLSRYGWVTDQNDNVVYENFCQKIEELAAQLGCSPLDAEERIFSVGGRNPGAWRAYLRENYVYQDC
jgi:hypothetical protein